MEDREETIALYKRYIFLRYLLFIQFLNIIAIVLLIFFFSHSVLNYIIVVYLFLCSGKLAYKISKTCREKIRGQFQTIVHSIIFGIHFLLGPVGFIFGYPDWGSYILFIIALLIVLRTLYININLLLSGEVYKPSLEKNEKKIQIKSFLLSQLLVTLGSSNMLILFHRVNDFNKLSVLLFFLSIYPFALSLGLALDLDEEVTNFVKSANNRDEKYHVVTKSLVSSAALLVFSIIAISFGWI